jgi:DNA-binding NtrC family response regulator
MALKRVLIVDDEQDLLEEHVVFLDVNMPGASGVEVLKLLKQTDPVIMVTANGEIPVAEACLKNGAMSYVPKPFNLVYMEHMVAVAIEQKRRPRP